MPSQLCCSTKGEAGQSGWECVPQQRQRERGHWDSSTSSAAREGLRWAGMTSFPAPGLPQVTETAAQQPGCEPASLIPGCIPSEHQNLPLLCLWRLGSVSSLLMAPAPISLSSITLDPTVSHEGLEQDVQCLAHLPSLTVTILVVSSKAQWCSENLS